MTSATKPAPRTSKGNLALRLNAIRQAHIYLSVFLAPMLLFWAASGALQVFRIPDKHPQAVIAKLASVHKNSTYAGKAAPAAKPAPKEDGAAAPASKGANAATPAPKAAAPAKKPAPVKLATTLLKWFFAIASILLICSTLLGLWMALAYHRRKGLLLLVLAAGTLIPVGLLLAAV